MNNNDILDEIQNRINIVDVISEYVVLKKTGANYKGLCPFHKEKTPSFSVSPDKNVYHCLGCHASGNMFTFIQEMENVNFNEAKEILAKKANVELPQYTNFYNRESAEIKSLKEKILEINELATKFFQFQLYKPIGKKAVEYINKRKMNKEIVNEFKIGYSVKGLYQVLKSKGYLDKEIFESKLVLKNEDGSIYERFYDRLMFPICDINGHVIGFTARRLDNDEKKAKYINTSETEVYTKGNHLFAFNLSKKYAKEELVLVEGSMDAISLYQRGVKNVVASLGTALTDKQANLIKNKTKKVILSYDSDTAGIEATLRGLDILVSKGVEVKILRLEDSKDPDEYILKHGLDAFRERMKNSISLIEYKISVLKKKYDVNILDEKIKFLVEISEILSEIKNEIERDIYIAKFSQTYGISKESIYLEINKILENKTSKSYTKINSNYMVNKREKLPDTVETIYTKREELIIYLFINNTELRNDLIEKIPLTEITNKQNLDTIKYLFNNKDLELKQMLNNLQEEINITEDNNIKILNQSIIEKLSRVSLKVLDLDVKKSLNDIFTAYANEKIKKRRNEILILLKNVTNEEEKRKLELELNEIIKNMGKLNRR